MADREKVIQWLEACSVGCEEGCPYEYDGLVSKVECKADLMRDALELLKAQEPVKPILKRKAPNAMYNDYVCPICNQEIVYEQKYCCECGRAVKWDA